VAARSRRVGPRLSLLRVPEPKVAKNRLHMDVRVAGAGSADERWARITEAVDRLAAAGATALHAFPGHHVVMADPEGNEFCVC
jgi:Glyoxalase-like domain